MKDYHYKFDISIKYKNNFYFFEYIHTFNNEQVDEIVQILYESYELRTIIEKDPNKSPFFTKYIDAKSKLIDQFIKKKKYQGALYVLETCTSLEFKLITDLKAFNQSKLIYFNIY